MLIRTVIHQKGFCVRTYPSNFILLPVNPPIKPINQKSYQDLSPNGLEAASAEYAGFAHMSKLMTQTLRQLPKNIDKNLTHDKIHHTAEDFYASRQELAAGQHYWSRLNSNTAVQLSQKARQKALPGQIERTLIDLVKEKSVDYKALSAKQLKDVVRSLKRQQGYYHHLATESADVKTRTSRRQAQTIAQLLAVKVQRLKQLMQHNKNSSLA